MCFNKKKRSPRGRWVKRPLMNEETQMASQWAVVFNLIGSPTM